MAESKLPSLKELQSKRETLTELEKALSVEGQDALITLTPAGQLNVRNRKTDMQVSLSRKEVKALYVLLDSYIDELNQIKD